jgi:integrase
MKAIAQIETKQNFTTIHLDALERFKDPKYKYECLAILIGLDTALRVSDLLLLKTNDISYNELENRFECNSNIQKTKVKDHKTLLSPSTYKAFKSMNLDRGYIFLNVNTNRLYTRMWLSKRTSLRYGFSFHTLRKISATSVLKEVGLLGAQKHLAHKRISSTDKYLGVTENDHLSRLAGSNLYK